MPNMEAAEAFLSALNNSHPSVNFTTELTKNSKLPFLRMEIVEHMSQPKTKVYNKPTDTGLLFYCQSHVDVWYK